MRRIKLVLSCLLFLGLFTSIASAAEPPKNHPEPASFNPLAEADPDDKNVLEAWNLSRIRLGFERLSPDVLRKLAESKQGQESIDNAGLPLTKTESQEIVQRDTVFDSAEKVIEQVSTIESYAGIHFELEDGKTVLVVRTTKPLTEAETGRATEGAALPDRVNFDPTATRTLAELEAIAAEIATTNKVDGVEVHAVGISIETNQVTVSIEPSKVEHLKDGDLDQLGSESVKAEVSPLSVDSACTSRLVCEDPVRGATEMLNIANGGTCTSGFGASDSAGNRYMITAAHCGVNGNIYRIGGRTNGSFMNYSQIRESESTDSAIAQVDLAQSDNTVFKRPINNNKQITGIVNNGGINAGRTLCLMGVRVGRKCGVVLNGNAGSFTTSSGTRTNHFTFEIVIPGVWRCTGNQDPFRIAGNSGGSITTPVGGKAIGILSACTSPRVTTNPFTGATVTDLTLRGIRIRDVETALNVSVLTN